MRWLGQVDRGLNAQRVEVADVPGPISIQI
jgi:hypothetical protein